MAQLEGPKRQIKAEEREMKGEGQNGVLISLSGILSEGTQGI